MNAINYFFGKQAPGDASNIELISPSMRSKNNRSSSYGQKNDEANNSVEITD